MKEGLIIIAISSPGEISDEVEKISGLLYSGEADFVHIRKPSWDIGQTRNLVAKIPPDLRERIKLHDHFSLTEEFRNIGVHLNSRNPMIPKGVRLISCSVHSIEQLNSLKHYDYVTLSPIFDSISKPGYKSSFDINVLKSMIAGKNVVALGGVTPDKFPALREAGFYGAAMLGYFWQNKSY